MNEDLDALIPMSDFLKDLNRGVERMRASQPMHLSGKAIDDAIAAGNLVAAAERMDALEKHPHGYADWEMRDEWFKACADMACALDVLDCYAGLAEDVLRRHGLERFIRPVERPRGTRETKPKEPGA